jgi:hypothetical protein
MIADVASIATAIGVLTAVGVLRQNQRQRVRQFEDMYVLRYWEIMDRLSLPALRGDSKDPLEPSDEKAVRAYFRLCEDELQLREDAWISDSTWEIWAAGIRQQMNSWPFREVWDAVTSSSTGSDADFTFLRRFMAASGVADPVKVGWYRRWVSGRTGRISV